ncbi:MAG: hypothetical protein OXL37_10445 [Chloroflexota bacterium]|nr:hypothetical protein [Chloroflexota bacterium]MDE2960568.1 hypothetical protein [Chloroflexota bacterium]
MTMLSAHDRMAARSIRDDIAASTTLDTVHTAVAIADRRNTIDAKD